MTFFSFLDGDVDSARRVLAIVAAVVHGKDAGPPAGDAPAAAREEGALPDLYDLLARLPAVDAEVPGAPEAAPDEA